MSSVVSNHCAVIVEPREHPALGMAIQSVATTLPHWPITLFHGQKNADYAKFTVGSLGLDIHYVEMPVPNMEVKHYNRLLTHSWFYRRFESCEFMLIFQTDSMLFPQCPYSVEDFMYYDYIGAPWKHYAHKGGNGGLSLRKIDSFIKAITLNPWSPSTHGNEDLYYSHQDDFKYASYDISRRFSVESCFSATPFGAHKFWNYLNKEEELALYQYAPEAQMLKKLNLPFTPPAKNMLEMEKPK
jgi:hypothetical protein